MAAGPQIVNLARRHNIREQAVQLRSVAEEIACRTCRTWRGIVLRAVTDVTRELLPDEQRQAAQWRLPTPDRLDTPIQVDRPQSTIVAPYVSWVSALHHESTIFASACETMRKRESEPWR